MPGILSIPTLSRRRAIHAGIAVAASALTVPALAAQDGAEYTFVVAGLDYREGHEQHNSDVLMVARVNTGLGTVNTVSIPRDLYVEIPGYGYDKITRAFHHGYHGAAGDWAHGAGMLTDTIVANFGVTIDGVATATFEGFEQIIDTLGGVTVANPYALTDPKMRDPVTGDLGRTWPEGTQTLDGESALLFVRSRNMDGDEGRVMRQQLVLAAILDQLQQPEMVAKLPELVDTLRDAVETNIPAEVQATLVAAVPAIDPPRVAFTNVADQLWGGTLDNGMWVYQADWGTLPGYVQALLDGQ